VSNELSAGYVVCLVSVVGNSEVPNNNALEIVVVKDAEVFVPDVAWYPGAYVFPSQLTEEIFPE
jgi:hypothetical protein